MPPNNESFNVDELEAPAWLNEQFLTEVLSKYENAPELKVLELKISPASAKGDHYASIMFRALVDYTCRNVKMSKSLIIKTMPEQEGDKKGLLEDSHIFETEIGMYTEALPKFEQILREAGDDIRLCVPCIYHSIEPRKLMIFEDLVPQGYTVVRDRSANISELRAAFAKLAKWHAVSYKILDENPAYLEKYKYDPSTLSNYKEWKFITDGLPNFIEMLGDVPSLRKFQHYFQQMQDTFVNRFVDVMRQYRENRKLNSYYVLCHGDFHLRNMMFKNNKVTGALEDCMLLDFQFSYGGPITNDILYAIYMLLGSTERKEKRDELLYYYFNTFSETLQKIGYEGTVPSLVNFRQQLFDNKYQEFFFLTTFLPFLMSIQKKPVEMSEFIENHDERRLTYFDEDFIKEVEYILPQLLHLGYFEEL